MIRKPKQKWVVCGGHLPPALAVIEVLLEKNIDVFYVGRVYSFERDLAPSLEFKVIKKLPVSFYSIETGRFSRNLSLSAILSLSKTIKGTILSFKMLLSVKPEVVLSFGGYVALPVCLASFFLKIPVFTHEQTPVLGLANRIISLFSKKLYLTWKDTKYVKDIKKDQVLGNPVRKSIKIVKSKNFTDFGNPKLPLIYVTGGSQGARKINNLIKKLLPYLLGKYRVVHQCGMADRSSDYRSLKKMRKTIKKNLKENYKLKEMIDPKYVGEIYKHSRFVVGRSGANTIYELILTATPSILIPLPHAADNEQFWCAKILEKKGMAKILFQESLTVSELKLEIELFEKDFHLYKRNARLAKKSLPYQAAEKLVDSIESVLNKSP